MAPLCLRSNQSKFQLKYLNTQGVIYSVYGTRTSLYLKMTQHLSLVTFHWKNLYGFTLINTRLRTALFEVTNCSIHTNCC